MIEGCAVGAEATQNATIDVENSTISNCETGIEATMKGHVDAEAVVADTSVTDVYCVTGSTVDGGNASDFGVVFTGTGDGSYVYL